MSLHASANRLPNVRRARACPSPRANMRPRRRGFKPRLPGEGLSRAMLQALPVGALCKSRAARNMHPCWRGFKPRLPGEGLSRAKL